MRFFYFKKLTARTHFKVLLGLSLEFRENLVNKVDLDLLVTVVLLGL